MILGLDTDILVHFALRGSPQHQLVREFLQRQRRQGGSFGLTQQVLWEFVHVVSDPRRFEKPMPLEDASNFARHLWDSSEVEQIVPPPTVLNRTLTLIQEHRLGRKRILDTALAATLESAGVRRLATNNESDFACFPFLTVVKPD